MLKGKEPDVSENRTLPRPVQDYVDRKVASGDAITAADALSAAVEIAEAYEQRLEALRDEIKKGQESGAPLEGADVFARLRERNNRFARDG